VDLLFRTMKWAPKFGFKTTVQAWIPINEAIHASGRKG
jgi:hypothetical protein